MTLKSHNRLKRQAGWDNFFSAALILVTHPDRHYYSLIHSEWSSFSVTHPGQSLFSLFYSQWKRHQAPVSVVARSGSFPSAVDQTAQNVPYLPGF